MILCTKDYVFLSFAFMLCFGFGAFSFWLGFPGYIFDLDTFYVLAFDRDDYSPIMNTLLIWLITLIFGKHTFYLFLLNNITLYLGIFFLMAGFYLRFKSIFALTPLFIAFIGNIYLANFIAMNYILMANFIFCAYSVILFIILTGGGSISKRLKITFWILIFILLFLGLLWRHNAIFSAFPVFFIIVYLFLKNRALDSKQFIKRYIGFVAISAVMCLVIAIELPRAISNPQAFKRPSDHLLLLQIAGACVPASDVSCFKDSWWYDNEIDALFYEVKKAYQGNPLNGDLYHCSKLFYCSVLDELQFYWIKAIAKYPHNFIIHESRFFKAMWWQNPRDDDEWGHAKSLIKSPQTIQELPSDSFRLNILQKWGYPPNEWHIDFSPLQERIYAFFYNNLPVLNHIIFVVIGFVLLIFSAFGIIWWRKCEFDKSLLIFTFSTALTSFASAFIIAAMAIVTHSRYMSPVVIFSIITLVGFVAFILEIINKSRYKQIK